MPLLGIKRQRNKRGPRLDHLESELTRQSQRKISGTQLRDRHAARSNHKLRCVHRAVVGLKGKTILTSGHAFYAAWRTPTYVSLVALGFQYTNYFRTGLITKQLATMLFMPAYTIRFN